MALQYENFTTLASSWYGIPDGSPTPMSSSSSERHIGGRSTDANPAVCHPHMLSWPHDTPRHIPLDCLPKDTWYSAAWIRALGLLDVDASPGPCGGADAAEERWGGGGRSKRHIPNLRRGILVDEATLWCGGGDGGDGGGGDEGMSMNECLLPCCISCLAAWYAPFSPAACELHTAARTGWSVVFSIGPGPAPPRPPRMYARTHARTHALAHGQTSPRIPRPPPSLPPPSPIAPPPSAGLRLSHALCGSTLLRAGRTSRPARRPTPPPPPSPPSLTASPGSL
ncbi:hypothetical protein DFH27DRAFT_527869 [Peziza echinospora]|nr:hypothetical protein DFH27DRAFT_527869 [Peziza echinospora]